MKSVTPKRKPNPRQPRVMYDSHKFQEQLGFESQKDMLQQMAGNAEFQEDVPRHLVIEDVGDPKFSGHPKRVLLVVLKRYLDIEDESRMPDISIWTDNEKTVVNVETKNVEDSEKLIKANSIYGVSVKVSPHKSRNNSVVRVWDNEGLFKTFTDEELKSMLVDHGVVDVKREEYWSVADNKKIPGNRYRLTYRTQTPPRFLRFPALGIRMQTELFIPPPMQCFHCQKLGHIADWCGEKGEGKVCSRCAERHEQVAGIKCDAVAKCVNCKGDHPSSHKSCPAYQQEFKIKKEAVTSRVSPRRVLDRLKESGQYINYSRTAARVVSAGVKDDRVAVLEKSMGELKEMFAQFLQSQAPSMQAQAPNMESPVVRMETENVELISAQAEIERLAAENRDLKNQAQKTNDLVTIVEELQKEVGLLKAKESESKQTKDECERLRKEVSAMKAEKEKLKKDSKKDSKKDKNDQLETLKQQLQEVTTENQLLKAANTAAFKSTGGKKTAEATKVQELEAEVVKLKGEVKSKEEKIIRIKSDADNAIQLAVERNRSRSPNNYRSSSLNRDRETYSGRGRPTGSQGQAPYPGAAPGAGGGTNS